MISDSITTLLYVKSIHITHQPVLCSQYDYWSLNINYRQINVNQSDYYNNKNVIKRLVKMNSKIWKNGQMKGVHVTVSLSKVISCSYHSYLGMPNVEYPKIFNVMNDKKMFFVVGENIKIVSSVDLSRYHVWWSWNVTLSLSWPFPRQLQCSTYQVVPECFDWNYWALWVFVFIPPTEIYIQRYFRISRTKHSNLNWKMCLAKVLVTDNKRCYCGQNQIRTDVVIYECGNQNDNDWIVTVRRKCISIG